MLFTKIGFECGSWNSNLKLNLSSAGLLENCQKSHFLAETDQNPPLQSSYKGSLKRSQQTSFGGGKCKGKENIYLFGEFQ